MFKVTCALMLVLFLVAAAVQYNDPDPLRWIAAYMYAFAATVFSMRDQRTPLPILGAVVYIPLFFFIMPRDAGPWIESEEAREALGILICGVWLVMLIVRDWRRSHEPGNGDSEPGPEDS